MKQIAHVLLFFLCVFRPLSDLTSARLLPPNQGYRDVMASGILHTGSSIMTKEDDLFSLMGLEECVEKDEECLKRRMVAEAHLDYIYTQHHKPKESP